MARKCKKNDKNPPLRCVLAGFAHLGAEVGGALVEGVGHRAGQLKAKDKLKKGEELYVNYGSNYWNSRNN